MIVKNNLASRLTYMISKRGINASQLSEMTGLTRTSISNFINEKKIASPSSLLNIAQALNVSYEWLKLGEGTADAPFDSSKVYNEAYQALHMKKFVSKKTCDGLSLKIFFGGREEYVSLALTKKDISNLVNQIII